MPNHCETDLTLKGKPDLIARVLAAHFKESGEMDCDSIVPYPARFKELDRAAAEYDKAHPGDWTKRPQDGFNQGGYEWCCNNWGTKWGTYDGFRREVSKSGRIANVSFLSAWSPPRAVLDKLAERYPDLTIVAKSYERGMGFKCDYRWEGGVCIQEDRGTYRGTRGG
jgi:hypothetical protein